VSLARGAVGLGSARGLGERGEPEPEGLWARIEPDQKWSLRVPLAGWADRLRPGLGSMEPTPMGLARV
jgi:hypothetical protein